MNDDMLAIICPIIVIFISCCIMGFVTKTISKNRGYYGGFWWGFLLGILGIIVVASKPVNPNPKTIDEKLKDERRKRRDKAKQKRNKQK